MKMLLLLVKLVRMVTSPFNQGDLSVYHALQGPLSRVRLVISHVNNAPLVISNQIMEVPIVPPALKESLLELKNLLLVQLVLLVDIIMTLLNQYVIIANLDIINPNRPKVHVFLVK